MKTIQNLLTHARIAGLYVVISVVFLATASMAYADTFNRQLDVGMSGADVSALQSFLAGDITLYPQGIVSGYYGSLTKAAVANFQSRHGLPAVGRVGPMTLPVLNLQFSDGTSYNASAPIISSVRVDSNRNSATVIWATNKLAKGAVYYSTSPLVTSESTNAVNVSGNAAMTDGNVRISQSVSLTGLLANTTYYYMIHTTDQAGNVSVTWPSTFKTTN